MGNREFVELAKEYYANRELTKFYAIFPALDIEIQKEYCNKMIEETKLAYFSSCVPKMNSDMIDYFAEKTYQEDRLTFFTTVVPYLTDKQKQTWIEKASRDNRITFLSVLTKENDNFPFGNYKDDIKNKNNNEK